LVTRAAGATSKVPGTEYRMLTVDEDYQGRRPFAGEWPKAERWLLAHGYRQLWSSPVRKDGCDVRMVWGKVEAWWRRRSPSKAAEREALGVAVLGFDDFLWR
jgi:hypothetical protein